MAKLAFLGLGVMGYPMAGHLLKKGGHDVTVYNRSAAKSAQWAKEYGGKSAPTPREAVKDCDLVMMCVGNDNDVRSVVYGDDGALAGMKKGSILVDHTTASAIVAREIDAKCKEKGFGFVDAPVSGGQAGAQNGQLGIMCGGDEATFAKAKPVLDLSKEVKGRMDMEDRGWTTAAQNTAELTGGDFETNHRQRAKEISMQREAGLTPTAPPASTLPVEPDADDDNEDNDKPA